LNLFLSGFISSLPQLAWGKKAMLLLLLFLRIVLLHICSNHSHRIRGRGYHSSTRKHRSRPGNAGSFSFPSCKNLSRVPFLVPRPHRPRIFVTMVQTLLKSQMMQATVILHNLSMQDKNQNLEPHKIVQIFGCAVDNASFITRSG